MAYIPNILGARHDSDSTFADSVGSLRFLLPSLMPSTKLCPTNYLLSSADSFEVLYRNCSLDNAESQPDNFVIAPQKNVCYA